MANKTISTLKMMERHRNMLEKSYSLCVHFCVIININHHAQNEHKNNPHLTFHRAVFCDVTTRRHIPQDCHDHMKLKHHKLTPDFNKF